MQKVVENIKSFFKSLQKREVYLALIITLSIGYYINPLDNVDIVEWNRTFCSAVLSGISIDARIGNFCKLFFIYCPLLIVVLVVILSFVFKHRYSYANYYSKFGIFLALISLTSYISRYAADASQVNENPMLQCMLAFMAVLTAIALIDKKDEYQFKDIVVFFLTFIIGITSLAMLFHAEKLITYVVVMAVVVIGMAALHLYTNVGRKYGIIVQRFLCLLMWLPAIIRAELEGIYFLTEKGRGIERYFTHITRATVIVIVIMALFIVVSKSKNWHFECLGYIGSIISLSAISYFQYEYQYTFSYGSMSSVYELGNGAVAMDTFLYGKLPIIDYFSAHAFGDVWTKLVYAFIHGDINGILVNPYGGLGTIIAFAILFFIIKQVLDAESAVIFVMLFPGLLTGIKWTSICCISIAMLLFICRKSNVKTYILFWVAVLIGAFMTYDEGISLGVASILAYIILCVLQRTWKKLRDFILSGAAVGGIVLVMYVIYAVATGIPVIRRIKEWISVSVGSSSSWATSNFGDQTTFAFLVSYFLVPMTAVILLVAVLVRYMRTKKELKLAILTIAFALTEILYITRTIVYHNLAVCSGWTGVLLNFIHWTVAAYVLYVTTIKDRTDTFRLFTFTGAMLIVILIEGTAVTHYWPTADSSLINKGLKAATGWDLQDDVTYNEGKARIVYDDSTNEFVSSFSNIFEALLTDDQTFIDFANVTSLYLMTGKTRPCYVGQSPSLLTDLYSQECFFNEISQYDCPLVVLGTSETSYLQQMVGIPHNVRYYKVAEYIYNNYRPLVNFGEFSIWCEKELWDEYHATLKAGGFQDNGYSLVDYGYDYSTSYIDEDGNRQFNFMPYHSYDLGQVPYIWANYDDYDAINNEVLLTIEPSQDNYYIFSGSQNVVSEDGNYIAFEATNSSEENTTINIVFFDSTNEGAKTRYYFTVKPGTNQYLIRASEDYFWDIFNINTIVFGSNESISIQNVRILEGD